MLQKSSKPAHIISTTNGVPVKVASKRMLAALFRSLTEGDQLAAQLAHAPQQLVEALLRLVSVGHEPVQDLLQLALHTRTLLHGSVARYRLHYRAYGKERQTPAPTTKHNTNTQSDHDIDNVIISSISPILKFL